MNTDESPRSSSHQGKDEINDSLNSQVQKILLSLKKSASRFWERLGQWFSATRVRLALFFTDVYTSLSRVQFIQIIISLAVASLAGYFSYQQFRADTTLLLVLGALVLGAIILGSLSWTILFRRMYATFIYYLAEHGITRKIISGGNFSYFEYKDPSQEAYRIKLTEPVGLVITTLFSLLGIAVTIIGIIRIINPDLDVSSSILWGILALVTPILATPIVPVTWAMDDARIKAWSEKYHTTWMISQRYKRRFNSIIAITAIISNLRENVLAEQLIEELQILLGILQTGALIMLVITGVFLFFYYTWFRSFLRDLTVEKLDLKCYKVKLIEIDRQQFQTPPSNEEPTPPSSETMSDEQPPSQQHEAPEPTSEQEAAAPEDDQSDHP